MRPGSSLLLTLTLLAACQTLPLSRTLSYGEVQAINPGVSAEWVLDAHPQGKVQRDAQGRVRSIHYGVVDPAGRTQQLDLDFDERGILRQKRYSGPVVRPAEPNR